MIDINNNAVCLMAIWRRTLDNYYVFVFNMHLYSVHTIGFIAVYLTATKRARALASANDRQELKKPFEAH